MSDKRSDEQVAMMQGEIDNLQQKVSFLEQKLKELQENPRIPSDKSWVEIVDESR